VPRRVKGIDKLAVACCLPQRTPPLGMSSSALARCGRYAKVPSTLASAGLIRWPGAPLSAGAVALSGRYLALHSCAALHQQSAPSPATTDRLLDDAKALLSGCRNVLVLTGAGISTESGVADYRSPGRPPHRPTSHQQFMASHLTRQRYWARSLLGFETLAGAEPNAGHLALAHCEKNGGAVKHIITQNVDLLHERAGSSDVLHLHGTIENMRCMGCGHISNRAAYQKRLRELNPSYVQQHAAFNFHVAPADASRSARAADLASRTHMHLISPSLGTSPVRLPSASASPAETVAAALRPDGDSNLPADLDYSTFILPSCSVCTDGHGNLLRPEEAPPADEKSPYPPGPMQHGVLKPDLVFFGASVPKPVHARADELLASADGLLVVGTSLTVWSAFRLLRATFDRIVHPHEVSVLQLADAMARESKANGTNGSNGTGSGITITDGAATIAPMPAYSPSTAASKRVPSALPIVLINQGPTRADPLIAAATNVIKIEHVRASTALKHILQIPDEAFQQHQPRDEDQHYSAAVRARQNIE